MIRRAIVSIAVGSIAILGTAWAQQPSFDIVGLRLGMTESEAVNAIRAYDGTLRILSVQSAFGYSDGVQQLKTEPFLSRIEGRSAKQKPGSTRPDLVVHFTPPPSAGRVWAIEREEGIDADQPSAEQFVGALTQKYGKPTAVSPGNSSLAWDFPPGRPNCILRPPDRPGFPAFRPGGREDLGFLLGTWQQRKLVPADASTCASRLHYVLSSTNGTVISRHYALMIDVAAYAASNEAATREVNQLEARARKLREGKGQAPRL